VSLRASIEATIVQGKTLASHTCIGTPTMGLTIVEIEKADGRPRSLLCVASFAQSADIAPDKSDTPSMR
jgi:hypothetical protein